MDKLAKIDNVQNDLTLSQVGKLFATSGFFQDIKGEAQAITKILAGAENGFGPFTSMSGIHIIKGKVELGADLIATGIKKSGKYEFRVKELTDQTCTIEFFERSEFTGGKWQSIGVSTFTQEDAKNAGISSDMYKKYGRNMLFARAITNGQAWFCPDVFQSRVYSDGEISGYSVEQVESTTEIIPEEEGFSVKEHSEAAGYNMNAPDLRPITEGQRNLLLKIVQSHVFTSEEKDKITTIANHPKTTRKQYDEWLNWAKTASSIRHKEETAQRKAQKQAEAEPAIIVKDDTDQTNLDFVRQWLGDKEADMFKLAILENDTDRQAELVEEAKQQEAIVLA